MGRGGHLRQAPLEPSTESLLVLAAPLSPMTCVAGATGGSPVGPSTPPKVGVSVPAESPCEFEATLMAEVSGPPEVTPGTVPDSAALLVSDMAGTETQAPSMSTDGAPTGAPSEEASAAVPGAQAALRALQVECGYASVPATPTLAASLISARARLVEVTQLKARAASLQIAIHQRDTSEDLWRGETMAAQDPFAVLSEQVANKRPYGAVDAEPAGKAPQGAEPSAKRQRSD